ncbi:uncharacterized protein [Epargyreus clarus]|uniref:uncharacterized protein isoform X2 n=1 Tax=Epargyreus clarus TaxID=520877 RepID=UPI003C2DD77F
MDGERKVNISEGVPLNSSGAANIFLNTEKPADVGVHINTTFSIASSKKIKLLFILNFLLSVICMVVCCWIAFYYWNEMISMRKQLDVLKEQLLVQNIRDSVINSEKAVQSPLVSHLKPHFKGHEVREPRMEFGNKEDISLNTRKYYVEDLGEDMLLVDSKKKSSQNKVPVYDLPGFQKESLVVHFNGAMREINLGTQGLISPWALDTEVSSKNSANYIELHTDHVIVKESGIYLVYAQVVYLTYAPNCYFIWARQPGQGPRLLSTCATGDDSSSRPLREAQMSCSVQTISRLYKGDTVNLAQREHNRTVWLRPGYTYFGFVRLSS